jgi:intraflagellar transport protein 122
LLSINDYKKVVDIYGEKKALDSLIEVCRQLDKSDNSDLIKQCAGYFRKNQNHSYAKEAYLKLGDNKSLMELHIQLEKWEEAFILAKQNEEFMDMLRLPYAEYLCKNDRFEDALKVYRKINRPDISQRILSQMACNAVDESRFP